MTPRDRHGYVPLIERLGGDRNKVDAVIAAMREEMLGSAVRCSDLINRLATSESQEVDCE